MRARLALLSLSNAKVIRGEAFGFITAILHLAPSWLSGFNVCPMASKGCAAGCLNLAGRGGMFKKGTNTNVVQRARIRKTQQFFNDRETFMALLVEDIRRFIRGAARVGLTPAIRLNGTSDIRWENVPVTVDGIAYRNIMEVFPGVQFYDYTKIPNRRDLPRNYHLTFSLNEENEIAAREMLAHGMSVAVVFATKNFPKKFWGAKVINGDVSDLRFLDSRGVIVGLSAKGPAKKDTTGFVRTA